MVRRALVLVTLLGALVAPARPAAAQGPAVAPAQAEQEFVGRINGLRAAKGLPRLAVHPELTEVARSWAASMAKVDRISHNPRLDKLVQADWQKLGENVGVGTTVGDLHDAFVASPTHYRNLVEPRYRWVGVGVVVGRGGALFTAHHFMQLRPAAAEPASPAKERPAADVAAAAPVPAPPPPAAGPPARLVLVLQLLQALDPS